jgi:hypothetical protein
LAQLGNSKETRGTLTTIELPWTSRNCSLEPILRKGNCNRPSIDVLQSLTCNRAARLLLCQNMVARQSEQVNILTVVNKSVSKNSNNRVQ